MLSSQLLFFFSSLGAFNGLLLTVYLALSKPASTERRLLAGLLFVISVRISKSIWFYFDPNIGKHFLQLGLSACLLIGPLLYEYVKHSLTTTEEHRFWKWHLFAWISVIIIVGFIYPYHSNPELWGDVFYRFINWIWGAYIILAALSWLSASRAMPNSERSTIWQMLSTHVILGASIIWLAYFTATYTSYIVGALSFSFTLYLTIILWVFNRREKKRVKYAERVIATSTQDSIYARLQELMQQEQLYKNANLTLADLARRVQVSVPILSQLLNDNLQKSFSLYVNEWRVNAAKQLLVEQPNLTMDLVAEACGYNSQSTFYAAFKQFEHTTPAKYRNQQMQIS